MPAHGGRGRGQRGDSRGGLCGIGAGALVEGAVLEAGGNGGGIVFGSVEGCCGVGGVQRRLRSGERRLNGGPAADAGRDGFFGGGRL